LFQQNPSILNSQCRLYNGHKMVADIYKQCYLGKLDQTD